MAVTKFAIITGASTGIGFELAHLAAHLASNSGQRAEVTFSSDIGPQNGLPSS